MTPEDMAEKLKELEDKLESLEADMAYKADESTTDDLSSTISNLEEEFNDFRKEVEAWQINVKDDEED